MIKHNQNGISTVSLLLGLSIVLLLGTLGFAGWAFTSRQDYKNNVDQKIVAANAVAVQKAESAKDVAFAAAEKLPLRTYTGPEAFGSVSAQYPKTWSGYVDASGNGQAVVDGYFYPGVVPTLTSQNSAFALRIQVLNQSYSQSLQALSSLQQNGDVTVSAYALPKVPKSVGVKVVGSFQPGKSGEMVILPLRNQTLQLSTESSKFVDDFEQLILPNFSFAP
ncbi:MAG: hypothetical protein ABIV43_02165 [Candidatus Saccharimonadales bacterium]